MKKLFNPFILLFSLGSFVFSCKENKIVFNENFENNSNKWDTVSTPYLSNKISNNHWVSTNELDNVVNFSLINPVFKGDHISIESSIKFNKFYSEGALAGLILFADDKKDPKEYFFFGINNENEVCISRESLTPSKAQTYYMQKNNHYKGNEFNKFSIILSNSKLQFLINNKAIIVADHVEISSHNIGFVTLGSQITVKNLILEEK